MSHLVKPVSFRVGKTQAWASNILLHNKQKLINSNLTAAKGIELATKRMLKRKRLYTVRGSIADIAHSTLIYKLIFMPRVKTKPRERAIGAFLLKSIYKPVNFNNEKVFFKMMNYVDARKDKIAKIRRKGKRKRLNKWLTKRLFRGASKIIWKKSKGSKMQVPLYSSTRSLVIRPTVLKRIHKRRLYLITPPRWTPKYRRGWPRIRRWLRRARKWRFDRFSRRRFNNKKFSYVLSRKLQKSVSIKAINLFSYLVSKRVLTFKTHQRHLWNFRYRRWRFQYKNYYDIINAFFSMGVLDHSEGFLLAILKITLPLILKIRKFLKFLHIIIKYMPEIQEKFNVFKIGVSGKLAGGTKRTKFKSIGYGVLPVQTLNNLANNNFMAYTHVYGEFGLKLTTAKNPKYIGPARLIL